MGEIAPGVLSVLINLVELPEFNGTTVEVVYKLETGATEYYDPIKNRICIFSYGDMNTPYDDWWGCALPNYNEFAFFRTKNLLPIGYKKEEDELVKDKEIEEEFIE
jgi:hypothetical protein